MISINTCLTITGSCNICFIGSIRTCCSTISVNCTNRCWCVTWSNICLNITSTSCSDRLTRIINYIKINNIATEWCTTKTISIWVSSFKSIQIINGSRICCTQKSWLWWLTGSCCICGRIISKTWINSIFTFYFHCVSSSMI